MRDAACDHCEGMGEVLEPSRTPEEPSRMIPCANCQGSPAAYAPGDEVTWRFETRGGWGYVFFVPAYVVKVTAKRVGIAAMRNDEEWVPRWVKPESLRLGHPSLVGVPS